MRCRRQTAASQPSNASILACIIECLVQALPQCSAVLRKGAMLGGWPCNHHQHNTMMQRQPSTSAQLPNSSAAEATLQRRTNTRTVVYGTQLPRLNACKVQLLEGAACHAVQCTAQARCRPWPAQHQGTGSTTGLLHHTPPTQLLTPSKRDPGAGCLS
jgi:hypothetical protein